MSMPRFCPPEKENVARRAVAVALLVSVAWIVERRAHSTPGATVHEATPAQPCTPRL